MASIIIRSGSKTDGRIAVSKADHGNPLSAVLARHGFPLNTRCGESGLCRGCEVELLDGSLVADGRSFEAPATVRACQAVCSRDAVIAIPARSCIEHHPQVGDTFRVNVPVAHQPLFMPEPGVRDMAFAADIGTTTVAVLLVDLVTGEILSRAGALNEQIRFGDNVLTRIERAADPQVLREMQTAVVSGSIAPLLARACKRAGRDPKRMAGGVVTGNTTMLHLLTGRDPLPLGIAPFTSRFLGAEQVTCGNLRLDLPGGELSPSTPVQLLPGIAAYVGADIAAGMYATGMIYDRAPSLLVDIGTNGELVLQHETRLLACATAAGPAFEGCGLRCGARAAEGVIDSVRLSVRPLRIDSTVLGNAPAERAAGICGSAYVDFLAEGRRCGLVNPTGRFDDALWKMIPERHRKSDGNERAIRLTDRDDSRAAVISEVDVAVLLQAKAAIGAGIETLLARAGLEASQIGRVYLSGGFGMHLNVANAIAIGLLPGLRAEQVEMVGNSSLAGAMLALLDRTTLGEMESLRARTELLELNLQEGFEDRYIDHLLLP